MNIILIGIQGCGKGTLVEGLRAKIDFSLISVGQLLRDEVATGSEIGKHIHKLQTEGVLVDIDIVIDVLRKKLKEDTSSIRIFDGFPRDSAQADAMENLLNVDLVVHLNLSKDVAINRLMNRLTCASCGHITKKQNVESDICPQCGGKLISRSDDTIEGINKRFEIYEQNTYPLLERYKESGVEVATIDANQTPEKVLEEVLKVIKHEHKN